MRPNSTTSTGLADAPRAPWSAIELEVPDDLTHRHIDDLLCGRIAGIRIPQMVSSAACEAIMKEIARYGMGQYDGMARPLGTVGENHWPARYVDGNWDAYFETVEQEERIKEGLFAALGGSASRYVNTILERAIGQEIDRLRTDDGRPFNAVVVRSGTAALHFDFGGYDLPHSIGCRVIRQMAWNIYVQNPGEGGDLVVHRHMGSEAGLTKAEAAARGVACFGNYDLDASILEGVEKVTIPARRGDFVLIQNRYVHSVAPVVPTELARERVALSAHIAQLTDGSFREFS